MAVQTQFCKTWFPVCVCVQNKSLWVWSLKYGVRLHVNSNVCSLSQWLKQYTRRLSSNKLKPPPSNIVWVCVSRRPSVIIITILIWTKVKCLNLSLVVVFVVYIYICIYIYSIVLVTIPPVNTSLCCLWVSLHNSVISSSATLTIYYISTFTLCWCLRALFCFVIVPSSFSFYSSLNIMIHPLTAKNANWDLIFFSSFGFAQSQLPPATVWNHLGVSYNQQHHSTIDRNESEKTKGLHCSFLSHSLPNSLTLSTATVIAKQQQLNIHINKPTTIIANVATTFIWFDLMIAISWKEFHCIQSSW